MPLGKPLAEHREASDKLIPLFSIQNTVYVHAVHEFISVVAENSFYTDGLERERVLFGGRCSRKKRLNILFDQVFILFPATCRT